MAYSLIPPIIVVLSLVGIIVFLSKKAPDVSKMKDDFQDEEKKDKRDSFAKEVGKGLKNKSLLVLERATGKFKVFFLKLGNASISLGESIKRKRNGKRREDIKPENSGNIFRDFSNKFRNERITRVFSERKEDSKKFVRPTLSEKIIQPKGIMEKKDVFEKILIERIASNPKDSEAYQRLGEYYMEIENWEYAKECFKQVLKLDSTNISVKAKMRKLEKLLER